MLNTINMRGYFRNVFSVIFDKLMFFDTHTSLRTAAIIINYQGLIGIPRGSKLTSRATWVFISTSVLGLRAKINVYPVSDAAHFTQNKT